VATNTTVNITVSFIVKVLNVVTVFISMDLRKDFEIMLADISQMEQFIAGKICFVNLGMELRVESFRRPDRSLIAVEVYLNDLH